MEQFESSKAGVQNVCESEDQTEQFCSHTAVDLRAEN